MLVITHMPAYDPHPAANSQFTDRWEARMYLRLVQRYQETHPKQHVIMMYGHARGFASRSSTRGPERQHGGRRHPAVHLRGPRHAGVRAGRPGWHLHFGLVRIGDDGDLQYTVEPALATIRSRPQGPDRPRRPRHPDRDRDQIAGDNIAPLTIPIADPASHVWTSSNPKVASVDPSTGALTAHRSGTVTVSVTSGGVTGSAQVVVQ
ncbi:Ig-like domain-containing protein [Streptomyces sp. T1317-0309]|nr:Ig-like domain-containing protein [Streptomyces sp. T1317-0309]